ncbi:MAG: hypothetical protein JJ975_11660 [Bacteroidia bacterium]|nr:hypothetical protein [Bacteroidia bacterium]
MTEREDMDWRLFEMLENELSEAEEAELLAELESNGALEDDWKLLQQTKLVAPEVTYQNKKSLLKKETKLIAFAGFSWMKYAAAAVVLVASYPLWKDVIMSDDVNHIGSMAEEVMEVEPHQSESEQIPEMVVPVEEEVAITDENHTSDATEIVQEPRKVSDKNNELPLPAPYVEEHIAEESQPKRYAQEALASVDAQGIHGIAVPTSSLPTLEYGAMNCADLYKTAHIEEETLVNKYKGIRPAVNGGLAWLSSPFRNSKLKIKPVDDTRGALKIEFTSKQYYATAMLSLKPIKEDQNESD